MKLVNSFISFNKFRGNQVVVKDYVSKNGSMREIITDLGQGKQCVRKIYYDIARLPMKVVDNLFGRDEIYLRDPQDFKSIILEANGAQRKMKNKAIESLVDILV